MLELPLVPPQVFIATAISIALLAFMAGLFPRVVNTFPISIPARPWLLLLVKVYFVLAMLSLLGSAFLNMFLAWVTATAQGTPGNVDGGLYWKWSMTLLLYAVVASLPWVVIFPYMIYTESHQQLAPEEDEKEEADGSP